MSRVRAGLCKPHQSPRLPEPELYLGCRGLLRRRGLEPASSGRRLARRYPLRVRLHTAAAAEGRESMLPGS